MRQKEIAQNLVNDLVVFSCVKMLNFAISKRREEWFKAIMFEVIFEVDFLTALKLVVKTAVT